MKEFCPICGSKQVTCLDNVGHKYSCQSCDEVFVLSDKPSAPPVAPRSELSAVDIYKHAVNAVVEISTEFNEESVCGTGFYISDSGYIITNAHVVVNRSAKDKYFLCESAYACADRAVDYSELDIVYLDPENDLALLKANVNKKVPYLKFAKTALEIGETVFAIGNGKGEGLSIVNGIVGDNKREFEGHSVFMFNALVTNGCSGGPIFNTRGEVCGVTVGGRQDAEGMKYGIPVDTVRAFIQSAVREKKIILNCR